MFPPLPGVCGDKCFLAPWRNAARGSPTRMSVVSKGPSKECGTMMQPARDRAAASSALRFDAKARSPALAFSIVFAPVITRSVSPSAAPATHSAISATVKGIINPPYLTLMAGLQSKQPLYCTHRPRRSSSRHRAGHPHWRILRHRVRCDDWRWLFARTVRLCEALDNARRS